MSRMMACLIMVFGLSLLASSAEASEGTESVREGRATLQGGVGVFTFLPSLRLVGRYSRETLSFEVRGGVLVPSFAIGKVAWDAGAALRYHVIRDDDLTWFVAPRVGLWSITDEDEPSRLAPMGSLTGGADLYWGDGWTATFEGGVGVVGGAAFNPDPPAGVILVELNAYIGWTF